jgi:DNA-binding MarR family transcriptional regulator
MGAVPQAQVQRFYRAFSDLVRAYQFRDRERTGEYGISVVDWYPLELLVESGPRPMGGLAKLLELDVSTVTRTVDRLEERGLVARRRSDSDRRVLLLRVTASGRALVERIQLQLMDEMRGVLSAIDGSAREEVTRAFGLLLTALRSRPGE